MSIWTTLAAIAGGVGSALGTALPAAASAAGPIAGGLIASRAPGSSATRRKNIDPVLDPLLSSLSTEALLGLGSTAGLPSILEQGSPMSQLVNEIMRTDQLNDKQKRRAVTALRHFETLGLDPFDDSLLTQTDAEGKPLIPGNIRKIRGELNRAIRTVGFAGFNDWQGLTQAENAYQQRAQAFQAQMAPIAQQTQMNRILAQAGLAQTGATAAQDLSALAGEFEPQIAQQFQDERNRILQAANAGRYNPGAALGRLGETQALTQRTSALDRALQLLGGRQTLITNALAPAQQLAQSVSGQRQGAALTVAGIGAAQQQAQQQLAQQRQENLGTGVASGIGQLGSTLQMMALLKALGGGPGTQPDYRIDPSKTPGPLGPITYD